MGFIEILSAKRYTPARYTLKIPPSYEIWRGESKADVNCDYLASGILELFFPLFICGVFLTFVKGRFVLLDYTFDALGISFIVFR